MYRISYMIMQGLHRSAEMYKFFSEKWSTWNIWKEFLPKQYFHKSIITGNKQKSQVLDFHNFHNNKRQIYLESTANSKNEKIRDA